jgi:hypothetical protein
MEFVDNLGLVESNFYWFQGGNVVHIGDMVKQKVVFFILLFLSRKDIEILIRLFDPHLGYFRSDLQCFQRAPVYLIQCCDGRSLCWRYDEFTDKIGSFETNQCSLFAPFGLS